jgi:rhodanese-related sulfurtransferase
MKRMPIALVALALCFVLVGCVVKAPKPSTTPGGAVMKIAPSEAKRRLDSEKGIVLLDVRTAEEYAERHIPGAVLLPVGEISERAKSVIPDMGAVYFVYCRSGNRSAYASEQLVNMGYSNVFDLGGIIDWPYETKSGQ